MMRDFRTLATTGAAVALAATLTACGSSSPGAGAAASSGGNPSSTSKGQTSTVTSAPSPAATEVNPAGDIPDNQAFVAFSPPGGPYQVSVPEGWARTSSGSTASFTDKLNSIEVAVTRQATSPTVTSVQALEVPRLASAVSNLTVVKVEGFTRPAGSGVVVHYLADSAPDPVTAKVVRDSVEQYLFWRSGTQVALTLSGPKGADNVDPWAKITKSFRWSA